MPENSAITLVKLTTYQQDHREECGTQAELLADQVTQALPRHYAEPRAHLLHHDQRKRHRNHCPKQRVAVLRAGLRIGQDAARVVVYIGRDEDPVPGPQGRSGSGFATVSACSLHLVSLGS